MRLLTLRHMVIFTIRTVPPTLVYLRLYLVGTRLRSLRLGGKGSFHAGLYLLQSAESREGTALLLQGYTVAFLL